MDLRRALTAFRQDPRWLRKAGLGLLVSFIPYVGAFAYSAWALGYTHQVAWGRDERLPEWEPVEPHLRRMLGVLVAGFVWGLPWSLVLLATLMMQVLAVVLWALGGSMALAVTLYVLGFAISTAFYLPTAAITDVSLVHFVLHGRIETLLEFRELWARVRDNRRAVWRLALLDVVIFAPANLVMATAIPMAMLPMALSQGLVAPSPELALMPLATYVSAPLLSLWGVLAQLVRAHYMGQYAAQAYGLPPAEERAAA